MHNVVKWSNILTTLCMKGLKHNLNVNRLIEINPTGSRQRKKFTLANIYLFKVNNKNTRKRCEICSMLTIKTPFSSVSIIDLEQVNVSRDGSSIE